MGALVLVTGCGGDETAQSAGTDFSPITAEEYVRIKSLNNVQSHPSLVLREIASPEVECVEVEPDEDTPTGTARFRCNADVTTEDGERVAHERWELVVGQEPTTGDLAVRSADRISGSIPPAPNP